MDQIVRAVSADGFVKISAITARDMVERARVIHDLSPTACAALGRTLCGASMLGELMKEADASLTIRVNGGGPAGSVIAVSDSEGNARGYVQNPQADLPTRADGKLDVGGLVGRDGMLTVSRDIGLKEPYVGSVELVSGEIAEDLAQYMVESEQIPSAVGLGVLIDTDKSVKAAGGFIVQLMPGAPENLIEKLETNILFMDQLTTVLSEDGVDAVISQVLFSLDPREAERHGVEYRCTCSRERVAEALRSVGEAELRSMAAEGRDAEVSCQFCDKVYRFTPEDLTALAAGDKAAGCAR
ncbi:MAG TPA: Hsp33 family molecular chaperone HslO [Candidatus Scatomorpha stercoravium]|nr:Hsp33 family molecular chaperone HslO [Candidatus Scatomorpha stercoravium]